MNVYACIYIYTIKVFIHLTNNNPLVECNLLLRLGRFKGRIKICKILLILFLMQENYRKQSDFYNVDWGQRNSGKILNIFSESLGY